MDGVEAVLTYGISGWPTWVHHEHREMHWHVPGIIEPDIAEATPARTHRYILLVQGPSAYVPGEGEQYMTATGAAAGGGSRRTPALTRGAGSRPATAAFRVIPPRGLRVYRMAT
jgi:hypothetical protein